jgi:hypothetical protein
MWIVLLDDGTVLKADVSEILTVFIFKAKYQGVSGRIFNVDARNESQGSSFQIYGN